MEGIDDTLELSVTAETFDQWWTLDFLPGYDDFAVDVLRNLEGTGDLSGLPRDEREELYRLIQ